MLYCQYFICRSTSLPIKCTCMCSTKCLLDSIHKVTFSTRSGLLSVILSTDISFYLRYIYKFPHSKQNSTFLNVNLSKFKFLWCCNVNIFLCSMLSKYVFLIFFVQVLIMHIHYPKMFMYCSRPNKTKHIYLLKSVERCLLDGERPNLNQQTKIEHSLYNLKEV